MLDLGWKGWNKMMWYGKVQKWSASDEWKKVGWGGSASISCMYEHVSCVGYFSIIYIYAMFLGLENFVF